MSGASSIEWTDQVWNPTTGCTRVSPGCKNCYAFALHDMRHEAFKAGKKLPQQYAKPFKELQLIEDRLTDPQHWRKPRRVFVNSMSDLFHEDIPETFIRAVFISMAKSKQHTFQVLTKRPGRMAQILTEWKRDGLTLREGHGAVLPNVWLGVSVEDQKRADERIPLLLQTPAAVRFLSCEPLLGPLSIRPWLIDDHTDMNRVGYPFGLSWVIVGGESGKDCRPCNVEWIRSIVQQCKSAGVACFVKQLGARVELSQSDAIRMISSGANMDRRRDSHGGNPDEWPEDVRIREFPKC